MSVKVTSFSGTMWRYFHDDYPPGNIETNTPQGHSGELDPSTIAYSKNLDGTDDPNVIVVVCPVDGDTSYWPNGGGADARLGQMLHLSLALKSLPRADAVAQLKARIEATDGPDRYRLTDADINEVAGGN